MTEQVARSPRPATLLVVGVAAVLAAGVVVASLLSAPAVSVTTVALVGLGVVSGEALRLSLPYRDGHAVRLAPSDSAVLAACVLASPGEVVLGACAGVFVWHAIDRLEPLKVAFNVAQFTVTAGAAAFTFRHFVGHGAPLEPGVLLPYTLAAAVFMLTSNVLVGAVLSTVTPHTLGRTIRRLLPPAAVLSVGGACLGLLATALIEDHLYLLPVVTVPVVFVMVASRQQVDARLKQERSQALVESEQAMSTARDAARIDAALVTGIHRVISADAAIWRHGTWVTPVPEGSGPCAVDAGHPRPVRARARELGPAVDAPAVAIGCGSAIVVAWGGDLRLTDDAGDWIERLVRSANDRSDRARAHAELEQERATLRRIVDGSTDGIYVLDRCGRVVIANPAMAHLLRTQVEALVGDPATASFGPGRWDEVGVADVARDGGGVWRVAVARVEDAVSGDVLVGVVHDVTAERRLSRMKDDMLAVVSHELRTPLTPIRAAAQLLSSRWDRLDDEARVMLLDQLAERAEHLTRLVEDLLLVAQMSGESELPRPTLTDLDLAAELRDNARHHDRARADHTIRYDGPAHCPLRSDGRRLRQIVDNLVDNACKFSPAGTTVQVGLTVGDGTVVVRVEDRGRGIPAQDLDRVFERFERAEDPLVMQTSGAGLGLYIVRCLVDALGGHLSVASVVGQGTTMTVELPLPPTADELPRSRRPDPVAGGAGPR